MICKQSSIFASKIDTKNQEKNKYCSPFLNFQSHPPRGTAITNLVDLLTHTEGRLGKVHDLDEANETFLKYIDILENCDKISNMCNKNMPKENEGIVNGGKKIIIEMKQI